MPVVLIIQEHLPEFRVPFYERLRGILTANDIDLRLVYAPNQRNTFLRGVLDWATAVPILWFGPIGWQPVLGMVRTSDLVIVQQESKYALNPFLQILSKFGGPPVAYWGHGKNFQMPESGGIPSRMKKFLATKVHWWFAYNDLSASVVRNMGYPAERITSVGNAVDTRGMMQRMESLDTAELESTRAELGLQSGNVAIYTGGLYPNKRVGFLIDAAVRIRRRIPDFELIIIGEGPDRTLVREAARCHSWIHDVGPKNDHDKIPYWALAKLLLMPGLVGLVVVDSFAFGVPLVTTDYPFHSPEIDYLENGVNGVIVACGDSSQQYAAEAAGLLLNPERLENLAANARASAGDHTIERMAESFATGIMRALALPRR